MKDLLKCDYCGRVTSAAVAGPCSACGHGRLSALKPKNHCCECGKPIYSNVSRRGRVVCEGCTLALALKAPNAWL